MMFLGKTNVRRKFSGCFFHSNSIRKLIIRSSEESSNANRDLLGRSDGLGFSMHQKIVFKGDPIFQHFTNHVQSVFVLKGEGEIEVVDKAENKGQGIITKLNSGMMFALDKQEAHYLTALSDELHTISVFNPPLSGSEKVNESGVFPAQDDDGENYYSFTRLDTSKIFKPPQSLKGGNSKLEQHDDPLF